MARMHVMEQSESQAIMSSMHEMLEKRLSVSSLAPCPVEFTASYVAMCATQSCGKCTPCRNGLRMLRHLFNDVLNNRATMETLDLIESTARTVYLSSDCAIGYEAGEVALMAIRGFRDDFEHHVTKHACGFSQHQTVPCVSGCPA
ncbi:MAG TPA: glutamate synthase, partial [Candidatus Olsenella avicola]|nr:glutamate synthase [Candidatus Olsenella avicola]